MGEACDYFASFGGSIDAAWPGDIRAGGKGSSKTPRRVGPTYRARRTSELSFDPLGAQQRIASHRGVAPSCACVRRGGGVSVAGPAVVLYLGWRRPRT